MSIRFSLSFLLLSFSVNSYAVQKAITDEGQIIILNSNNTWYFENSKPSIIPNASLNSKNFSKIDSQSFKIKALPTAMELYIDPEKWSFSNDRKNFGRLSFHPKSLKNSDIYGLLVSEAIEIDFDSFTEIALSNAKNLAADMKIVSREYRVVNGSKILYIEMEGTYKSIKTKCVGYYASNKSGNAQLLVFSASNIIDSKRFEIEEFLNGFVGN